MKLDNAGKWMGRILITSIFNIAMLTVVSAQTTYTVSNTNDDGAGSLRQAIIDAEAHAGTDIINATGVTGTITLATGLPNITESLTINGSGKGNLFISGNNVVRPFFIMGGTVQIKNLSIINGLAQGGSPSVGGGGGAGMGGGVYIDGGTVTFTTVAFTGNSAKGGNSNGDGSYGYGSVGGDGPFANSGGTAGYGTSSYQGGNGGPGSFGAGGGSGGYGRYAGGAGGNGGFGGGAGAVGSKYDGSSGAWSTVYPGTPGEFGGTSVSANFTDTYRRSGGGGAGLGGAVFARSGSTVNFVNTTFSNNSAVKGTGNAGYGGGNGKGKGGAVFVHEGATAARDGGSFSSNSADDDIDSETDNNDFYGALLNYAPKVKIADATMLTASGATLNGSVDKNGYSSTYKFQYSTSSDLSGYLETASATVPAPPVQTIDDGNALSLNESGSGAYVSIPDNGSMDFVASFTVEAWIYMTDNTNNTIIDKGGYQYLFQVHNGELGFYSVPGTYGQWKYSTNANIQTNKWTHVALTYDYLNGVKFYVNGEPKGSGTVYNALSTDNGDVNIGRQEPSSCQCNTFNGRIDELKVWSTVRTASEISANYNKILTGSETGLVAYYHFDETSGTSVADATSNGNNGTIQAGGSLVNSDIYPATTYAPVSKAISGLTPGTKYYFRLSSTNAKGTTLSPSSSFIYSSKPGDIALWMIADSGITASEASLVSQWNDLSGNGLHATQPTGGNQPTLVAEQLNGHSVIRFDGSNTYMTTPSFERGQNMSVVMVTKTTSTTGGSYGWQRVLSDDLYMLIGYNNSDARNYFGNGAWQGGNALGSSQVNNFQIRSTIHNGISDKSYINGVASSVQNFTRSSHTAPLTIGAGFENGSYVQHLSGDIAEIIIFNKLLTDAERLAIEGKLTLKYKIGAKSTVENPTVGSGETGQYVLGSTGASVNFTTGSGTSGSLTGSVSSDPTIEGDLPESVNGVNSQKYWSIQNNGLTGITYSITLDFSDVTGIADFRAIRILKRENSSSPWKDVEFAPFNATVTYDQPYITVSGLTSFSEFGFGESSGVLPVELSSFTASVSNNRVQLNWATTTETNNYGFEIEKSVSGSDWTKVGFVAGKGTTTEKQSYSFTVSGLTSVSKLKFRLKQIDADGRFEYSNILSVSEIPHTLELSQNYPNPFNPTTNFAFTVPSKGLVRIAIYDVMGREIRSLMNKEMESGSYSVILDAKDLASGIYFCKLAFNGQIVTKKLTLLK